jgi:hypothetical protein
LKLPGTHALVFVQVLGKQELTPCFYFLVLPCFGLISFRRVGIFETLDQNILSSLGKVVGICSRPKLIQHLLAEYGRFSLTLLSCLTIVMTNNLGKVNIDFRDSILRLQEVVETFALCSTWKPASCFWR